IEVFRTEAMRFHTNGVNTRIGTTTAGHLSQSLEDVDFFIVDCIGATIPVRFAKTRNHSVDRNHALRSEHKRAFHCEQSNGSASPNSDGVSALDVAIFRCHVPGWKNVRKKQYLLVPYVFIN